MNLRLRIGALAAMAFVPSAIACGASTNSGGLATVPDRVERRPLPTREQAADFAVLRTQPEGLPANVRRLLRLPIGGLDRDLAQQVPFGLSGTYWLLPGTQHMCLVSSTPGAPGIATVCATSEDALRHGVAVTTLNRRAGTRLVAGVVPDGTRTVLVRTGKIDSSVAAADGRFTLQDASGAPVDRLVLR